jgi:phospholipid/cholesterol/gamma-HCH transport system permease protein
MNYGEAAVGWVQAWGRAVRFGLAAFAAAFSRTSYDEQTRDFAFRQIYFTALQVLPGFLTFTSLVSVVITLITVGAARDFGLAPFALELVFRALVLEALPLLTALFVALRSGSAINTEIALMQLSGELAEREAANLDPLRHDFVPRIAAAAISVLCLTVAACTIAVVIAYIVMYGLSPWGFEEYTLTVANVFSLAQLAGFAIKSIAFGVVVAVIPIAAGLETSRENRPPPVAVMGGMVRLFFALGVIELVSLAVKYV